MANQPIGVLVHELFAYAQSARSDADLMHKLTRVYGDGWQRDHAAAECAYIEAHKRLPSWTRFVERFEDTGNGLIFVHADPDKAV